MLRIWSTATFEYVRPISFDIVASYCIVEKNHSNAPKMSPKCVNIGASSNKFTCPKRP